MAAGAKKSGLVVAIVAYGDEDHLASCLSALEGQLSVLVVDNGASDRASSLCKAWGAEYVRSPGNVGYASGVNTALRSRRGGEHVLLLNPDARITPRNVELLVRSIESSADLAAVAPKLLYPDESEQKTVWPMPSPWVALAGVLGLADRAARRYFLNGAVLLLRGDAITQLGDFDERYFLYAEEADWQLRALRSGWRVSFVPEATAIHAGGATSTDDKCRDQIFHASAELFIRKWYGERGWTAFRMASILAAARRWLTRNSVTRETQARVISAYLRGPVRAVQTGRESI